MFKSILKFFKKKYNDVIHSIAFYPVLISLVFLAFAITSLEVENLEFINTLKEKIPYLFIDDYETARAILSTIIGGILSLTVFSFSMVMVVLNQASSNFSPRLLPSLISNKRHQIILGFYIGTLLYCIIMLTKLGAYGIDSTTFGLSTMLASIASLVCIGLFVYFINSISVAIQIHNIIDRIFHTSNKDLDRELENQSKIKTDNNLMNSENWKTITVDKTGYYRGFDISLLNDAIKDNKNHIEIIPYKNAHIWKGMPIIKVQEKVSEDDYEEIIFCLNISSDPHEGDEGISGMIKLMEIAVKAMSPGINDPGTAIAAVNRISELLFKSLQLKEIISNQIPNKDFYITEHSIIATELMRVIIQPIRLYSKKDNSVLYVLLKSLLSINDSSLISVKNKAAVKRELEALRQDIEDNIDNKIDKEQLMELFLKN